MKWWIVSLLFSLFLTGFYTEVRAQKLLQLERSGTLKVKRYYAGDEIVYLLKNEGKNWRRDVIMGLNTTEGVIFFTHGHINLRDIIAIKPTRAAGQAKTVSKIFYGFALNWGFWSVVGLVVGQPVTLFSGIVIGSALGVGWIAGEIIKAHTIHLNSNHRLRMLDLTMYPVSADPVQGALPDFP